MSKRKLVSGELFEVVLNENIRDVLRQGGLTRVIYGKRRARLENRYYAHLTPKGEIEIIPGAVERPKSRVEETEAEIRAERRARRLRKKMKAEARARKLLLRAKKLRRKTRKEKHRD